MGRAEPANFTADERRPQAAEPATGGVEVQMAGQCCPTYRGSTERRRRRLEHGFGVHRLRRFAVHVYDALASIHQHLRVQQQSLLH